MPKKMSPTLARLHRLQGQLEGVETMLTKDAQTSKVLQQLEAVRGGIRSLVQELIAEKARESGDEELKQSLRYLLK